MFSVGNVAANSRRDSSEDLPRVKELESRYCYLRDPLLDYEDDTEFHDAIRQMVLDIPAGRDIPRSLSSDLGLSSKKRTLRRIVSGIFS
jgi:hypothetical protein